MILFETIINRLHVLFGFFFFWGGGAIKAPNSRVCDWGMFSLLRGIMPDQEGLPYFLKEKLVYENEEFTLSSVKWQYSGFIH